MRHRSSHGGRRTLLEADPACDAPVGTIPWRAIKGNQNTRAGPSAGLCQKRRSPPSVRAEMSHIGTAVVERGAVDDQACRSAAQGVGRLRKEGVQGWRPHVHVSWWRHRLPVLLPKQEQIVSARRRLRMSMVLRKSHLATVGQRQCTRAGNAVPLSHNYWLWTQLQNNRSAQQHDQ